MYKMASNEKFKKHKKHRWGDGQQSTAAASAYIIIRIYAG
jgi:hypothetical protein